MVGCGSSEAERGPEGGIVSLGDQESIRCDAQGGMMMEAAPSAPFIMAESDLLLEFLIIAFDAPPLLCSVDQIAECDVGCNVDSEYLEKPLAINGLNVVIREVRIFSMVHCANRISSSSLLSIDLLYYLRFSFS